MNYSDKELNEIFKEYSTKLAILTKEIVEQKDPVKFQLLFEALAFELGYVDGIGCIFGAKHEDRIKTKNVYFKIGKKSAYEGHTKDCTTEGCPISAALDIEINGN